MLRRCSLFLMLLLLLPNLAKANARAVLYGHLLSPQNSAAKEVSRDGFGGGLSGAYSLDPRWKITAISCGIEATNLLSDAEHRQDPDTLLRTVVETSQNLIRAYVGGEFGSHSGGFFRPHVATHVALMIYRIDVNVRVPNDANPANEIVQELETETETRFGFDTVIGADFNIRNQWLIEAGVRYVKSFGVPQQLTSTRATEIYPDYFQYYVGVGISFNTD